MSKKAHEWLDKEYPSKEVREKITVLDLEGKDLEEQKLASTSKNNSSAQLLDENTFAAGSASQPTNVFRKRTISISKENKSSQGVYELVDLQGREEL
jgi:hypothetical protein